MQFCKNINAMLIQLIGVIFVNVQNLFDVCPLTKQFVHQWLGDANAQIIVPLHLIQREHHPDVSGSLHAPTVAVLFDQFALGVRGARNAAIQISTSSCAAWVRRKDQSTLLPHTDHCAAAGCYNILDQPPFLCLSTQVCYFPPLANIHNVTNLLFC